MPRSLSARAGFWVRRVCRRTFVVGIFRKLRELAVRPYTHWLLAQASRDYGAAFTVVQVGAHDGQLYDPLSALVFRHRWSGVLVEPNPRNFEKLRQTYRDQPQIRLEQAAITESEGTVTLYRPVAMPDGGLNPFRGLDSLFLSHFEEMAWIDKDWRQFVEEVEVPSLTLSGLLEKHHLETVHFFLTDTEGCDKAILDQLDRSGLQPTFLQFEFINIPGPELSELKARLRGQGYTLLGLRWDIFAYKSAWRKGRSRTDQPPN